MIVVTADWNESSSVKPSLNFPLNLCISARNATRLFHVEVIVGKQGGHRFDVQN